MTGQGTVMTILPRAWPVALASWAAAVSPSGNTACSGTVRRPWSARPAASGSPAQPGDSPAASRRLLAYFLQSCPPTDGTPLPPPAPLRLDDLY